jgi:Ras homolog gene family, member A
MMVWLGKTSLLYVFANGVSPNEFFPAVFGPYVADLELDGCRIEIALWDTAGQEDYDTLRPLSYSNSHVILICYAIDMLESLKGVTEQVSIKIGFHLCSTIRG